MLKRYVLRCLRKEAILSQNFNMVGLGSSFQMMGAATEKSTLAQVQFSAGNRKLL